jgi:DNA mismatch endonuclease (patch repair protein)
MMSGIKGFDTKPEMMLRQGLHRLGFRYRLHDKKLPGKPDLVFPKYHAVLFVNGCFWHGHSCHLFKWPKSRGDFWRTKIVANTERDRRNLDKLGKEGWRVGLIWECALKGRSRKPFDIVIRDCAAWLCGKKPRLEISGND